MASTGEFQYMGPHKVTFGPGSRKDLLDDLEAAGVSRALLIVSNSLYTESKLGKELEVQIAPRTAATFTDTKAHVPQETVLAATALGRKHDVDAIVSFGGGSVSDLGKAVALALAEEVTDRAGLAALSIRITPEGEVHLPTYSGTTPIPHWTIPTTLSAAEFSSGFGVTDVHRGVKDGHNHPSVAVRHVILDAEVTIDTPMDLWLSTGMRSIDHCVECCYSLSALPFVTALCEDALRVLVRDLDRTRRVPGDLDARQNCQLASWQAGFGLTSAGVGISHAIGHQIGARYGVPHGITTCVTLPAAVQFNQAEASAELANLAPTFEVSDASEVAAALRAFISGLGLPTRLGEVGITEEMFDQVASGVLEDRSILWNPRPVDREGIFEVLATASR